MSAFMRDEEDLEAGPDQELLRSAVALVYVEDLHLPQPSEEDRHHLLNVLRLRSGESVIAADGSGAYVSCVIGELASGSRNRARVSPDPTGVLSVVGEVIRTRRSADERCVAFAMPKGERAEWTIQKLTELGVDKIVPLMSERSVVRLNAAEAAKRGERFRRISREAGSQSRRPRLPVLSNPVLFREFLSDCAGEDADISIAEPGGEPLTAEIRTILVGPEGGWSNEELAAVPRRVGLGPTVLRAETAAIAAGTLLVSTRWGAMS
jgi:16S rRNA (uracil1498-N3)-methyltransferase